MWRITIAGLRAHARRMIGTVLAVVLGVGFVTGTLVFGSTASAGYFAAFARAASGVDVDVQPAASRGAKAAATLPAGTLDTVAALPDVAAAAGRMVVPLPMLGRSGKPLTNFGNVGVGVSTDGDARLREFNVTGRVPAGPGEAMLDTDTAAHERVKVGDTITVAGRDGSTHAYRVVGLIDFGVSKTFAGESVVGLPRADLLSLSGTTGYSEIVVAARAGVSQPSLTAEVRRALGAHPRVVTGDQLRTDLANSATSVASQFTTIVLIFAGISLIVAAFVIYNTFAVLLAQRIRETALLRCVGATRRQVFVTTLSESALLGLAGGGLGALAGIGIAALLFATVGRSFGGGIPEHGIVVTPTSIIVGVAIGLGVTVASALLPAARSTRTSPLQALRWDAGMVEVSRVRRLVRAAVAGAVLIGGLVLTVTGTRLSDSQTGTFTIVAGGVVTFLGVLIAAPLYVAPLSALIGRGLAALVGTPARVAAANTRRNPARAAITTATLMIGVGLMALFAVVLASIQQTAHDQLVGHYPVDYFATGVRYGDAGGQAPVPTALAAALRGRPEFSGVAEIRTVDVIVAGHTVTLGAVDPAAFGHLITVRPVTGQVGALTGSSMIAASDGTSAIVARTGAEVAVAYRGVPTALSVVATAPLSVGGVHIDGLVSWDQLDAIAGTGDDAAVLVKAAPGVSSVASRDELDHLTAAYPLITVSSIADLTSGLQSAVNALVGLFGGLIGIAVLISLFGVANTLSMSVVERTRESATLRAVGLTRAQLRGTLLIEALLMGLVGAVIGVTYGVVYGRMIVAQAFNAIGPTTVTPWAWIAGLVVLAGSCAVMAAVLPARRAARASIVSAMAEV